MKSIWKLFLEDRVTFPDLLRVLLLESKLFTTEDDALEQEDVVFAIDVGLGHDKHILEQKFTEVGDMMTLPILDSAFEVSHRLHIFSSALSLVNLVRDTFGRCTSFL